MRLGFRYKREEEKTNKETWEVGAEEGEGRKGEKAKEDYNKTV